MAIKITHKSIATPWKLPDGWEWIPLGEICDIVIGRTPRRNNHEYWGNGHTWVSIADLNGNIVESSRDEITDTGVANSNVKLVEPGTILMSFKLTIGKLGIAGKRLYTNEAIAALPLKNEWKHKIERNFIFQSLHIVPLTQEADLAVKGKTLNKEKLARLLVPVPFPNDAGLSYAIQHRIVSRLESLLAELRGDRQLLDEMRRDTSRVMEATLTEFIKELDKQYPDSPTIGELFSTKHIKILWGGTPPTDNEQYWVGSIPWASPRDMKRWYIDATQKYISQAALQQRNLKLIPEGSVLIVVRGMILAHTLPVGITKNEVTINQDMKALVPDESLLPEYLGYILRARAPSILQQVETAAHGTRRLKTDTLKKVTVPIISISDQRRIIEYLDFFQFSVNEIEKVMKQDTQLLEQLEQSILEKAFRGQL